MLVAVEFLVNVTLGITPWKAGDRTDLEFAVATLMTRPQPGAPNGLVKIVEVEKGPEPVPAPTPKKTRKTKGDTK